MVKENIVIETLKLDDIKSNECFHLINCKIDTIDLVGVFHLNVEVKIEDCLINELKIHSCWFTKGLLLKNCIVKNYVDYQMGGHNTKPILIEGNIFNEFVNFFDCQFEDIVEVKNNIFIKGTNLIGNKGEGFENTFYKGLIENQNLGNINKDGL